MPTDLVDALGGEVADHPIVLVMRRDAVRPVPPRSQPEYSASTGGSPCPDPHVRAHRQCGDHARRTRERASGRVPNSRRRARRRVDVVEPVPVRLHEMHRQQRDRRRSRDRMADAVHQRSGRMDAVQERGTAVVRSHGPSGLRRRAPFGAEDLATRRRRQDAHARRCRTSPTSRPRTRRRRCASRSRVVTGRTVRVTVGDVREERSTPLRDVRHRPHAGRDRRARHPRFAPAGRVAADRQRLPRRISSRSTARPLPVRITGRAATADQVMALTVTPCDPRDPARVPELTLGPGAHALTSARGKDVGVPARPARSRIGDGERTRDGPGRAR